MNHPSEIIRHFQLQPHPEGGHYREFYRSPESVTPSDGRPPRSALTLIHFLLQAGESSAWHRVLSDETWHWSAGAPMDLWLMPPDLSTLRKHCVGPLGTTDAQPVCIVPAGWWQAARPQNDWSMVHCAVAPGFDFADFALWDPHLTGGKELPVLPPPDSNL